jgi:AcrR family transcriptional regulator
MGERIARVEATRERIVEAAIELYAELGISGTTMRLLALRADVAPGTLRNHFGSREVLDRALIERLGTEAPLPELSMFEGAGSVAERLRRLIRVTGTFMDQSARIQKMWLRERMLTPVWIEAGATYGARWDQLFRSALGPLADDPDAMAMIRAVLEPSFFEHVRGDTRTTTEVSDLIASVITPWFAQRLAAQARRRQLPPR